MSRIPAVDPTTAPHPSKHFSTAFRKGSGPNPTCFAWPDSHPPCWKASLRSSAPPPRDT